MQACHLRFRPDEIGPLRLGLRHGGGVQGERNRRAADTTAGQFGEDLGGGRGARPIAEQRADRYRLVGRDEQPDAQGVAAHHTASSSRLPLILTPRVNR